MNARTWTTRADNRAERLARAASVLGRQLDGKLVAADAVTDLLHAVIEPHDRVCLEGNNQKQADFLARALMHRPRLLILDEPTAGVDVELRLELWHYVQQVNSEGTSILLTTHYLEEAEQLCSRIAFINGGEIVDHGSSDELAERFGVGSLEDAYLELVGRKELSRAHVGIEAEDGQ